MSVGRAGVFRLKLNWSICSVFISFLPRSLRRGHYRFAAALFVGTALTFPVAHAASPSFLLVGQGGNGGAGTAVSTGSGGKGGGGGGGGGGLGGGGAGGQGSPNDSGGGGGFLGGLKGENGNIGGAGQIVGGGGGGAGGTGGTANNGGAGGSAGSGAGGSGTQVTGTASNTGANGAGGAGGPGDGSGGGGGGGIGGGGGGGGNGSNGGTGGYGAGQGTNAGVGGYSEQSGSSHSQNALGTGGNAIASDLEVITSPTYQINNAQTYEYVGVGGGGGGGGGQCSNWGCLNLNNASYNGDDGSNNTVAVGIGGSLSATSILLGGGGGGGSKGNGGNGGKGVLNVAGGSVTTSQDLQIGAGGGASGGGGSGGNGTLTVSGGVVSVGRNLQVGGDGGMDTSGGPGGAGQGGQGTMSVTGGSVTVGQALHIGGNGGAGGSGSGGFGGNGTLNINGSTAVLFVKTIVLGGAAGQEDIQNLMFGSYGGNGGNGTLELENGGTLVLGSGSVVQTGDQAYQVVAGQSNGTGTFGISGTANIEVDSGNTATIDVPVSGTGVLTKDGAGTLIQAVASTYTGGTTINGGVLQIGSASSLINYNETASGPLTVSITPEDTTTNVTTLASPLTVNGTATLGGSLTVNLNPSQSGAQYNTTNAYRILTATQGVTRQFTSITLGGVYAPYFLATALYQTDEADLTLRVSPKTYESGHVRAASSYGQNMALFDVLSFQMQADAGYWMHGVGSFGHAPGLSSNYKGFLVGRGFNVTPHLVVGGAISNVYTHSSGADGAFIDGTSFGAEAYGVYSLSDWRFTGIASVGHLGNRSTRYMPELGAGKAASNGLYEGLSLRADYDWINRTHLFLSPYAEAEYLHTIMGRGQESGLAGLNMRYGQFTTDQTRAGGGVIGGYKVNTGYGALTAWAGLGGLGMLGNTHVKTSETVMGETGTQSVQVSYVGAFTPSAGIVLAGQTKPWKLTANWQGQFADRFAAQSFTLGGSYKF